MKRYYSEICWYFYCLKREFWNDRYKWWYYLKTGQWSELKRLLDYRFWVYDVLWRCRVCGISYYAYLCQNCGDFCCDCGCWCHRESREKWLEK